MVLPAAAQRLGGGLLLQRGPLIALWTSWPTLSSQANVAAGQLQPQQPHWGGSSQLLLFPPPAAGAARAIVTCHSTTPQRKRDPYRTPPRNYVQLLQHISRARTLDALTALAQRYGDKFDAVHVAAAMAVMPKLHRPPRPGARLSAAQLKQRKQAPQQLLAELQRHALPMVPRMFAKEAALVTWSLGRLRSLLPGGSGHNATTGELVSRLLAQLAADNGRRLYQGATGAQAAQLLHGLARLKLGAKEYGSVRLLCRFIAAQPQRLHAREAAACAWALAKIGPREGAARAALDALAARALQVRLYLRPTSMAALLVAAVNTGRRDEQLLDAIMEEAGHQLRSFRPRHLAVFTWALGRLGAQPPPELTAGLAAAARRQLERFNAQQLGQLLAGLTALRALDPGLLEDVAAGIAKEREVALSTADAARLLGAYVAAPAAGKASDVARMASLVSDALLRYKQPLMSARSTEVVDLLVCASKLGVPRGSQEALVARLLSQAAARRDSTFTMRQWGRMLVAAEALGLAAPAAARAPEVAAFYSRADAALQAHLLGAAAPGQAPAVAAGAKQQQPQQQQEQGGSWWPLGSKAKRESSGASAASGGEAAPARRHALQYGAAADVARLLGVRGSLSQASAGYLADVGAKLLPDLKPRVLMQLLTAVTSGDRFAAVDDVRRLLPAAAAVLSGGGADGDAAGAAAAPSSSSSSSSSGRGGSGGGGLVVEELALGVQAGLARPLGAIVGRNLVPTQGEGLLRRLWAALAPQLGQLSEEQLRLVWSSLGQSGLEEAALAEAAAAAAAARGWELPALRSNDWGPLGL